jgi:hypothetical protein
MAMGFHIQGPLFLSVAASSGFDCFQVNGDSKCMDSASKNQAVQGTHIAEVATPGKGYVSVGRNDVVGWVHVKPAESRTIRGNPRVGGIGTDKPRLSRRRIGAKISADISSRKTDGTEARDLNVRKILANASPFPKNLFNRCPHICHF